MIRYLPGTKPSRFPGIGSLSDLLPDPNRPALRDIAQRNIYFQGSLESDHTTLSVNDEANAETDGMPQRLSSVEVQGVTGGTVTVQVQVNGVDAFDDSVRPVSDAGPEEVTDMHIFPAGAEVKTIIEATSGVPAGTANVQIDTEPYVLLGKYQPVELQGKDRLFPSRRQVARALNTNAVPAGAEQASRLYAYSYGGTSPLVASSSTLAQPPHDRPNLDTVSDPTGPRPGRPSPPGGGPGLPPPGGPRNPYR